MTPKNQLKRLTLTVPEAGIVLGIGTTAAWRGVRSGAIPSLRLGRRVVVPVAALERLLGGQVLDQVGREELRSA